MVTSGFVGILSGLIGVICFDNEIFFKFSILVIFATSTVASMFPFVAVIYKKPELFWVFISVHTIFALVVACFIIQYIEHGTATSMKLMLIVHIFIVVLYSASVVPVYRAKEAMKIELRHTEDSNLNVDAQPEI
ncbi:hypothetical protein M3Y94_00610700 [Aphelenchoides besseyi]|nr:hypothetical protein M3Y94_00610700 [Aphelenchoides besseyi]